MLPARSRMAAVAAGLSLAVGGATAAGSMGPEAVRPSVVVELAVDANGETPSRVILSMPHGSPGSLEFVNSVTGSPVTIRFRVAARFEGFSMETDAAAEEYYTAGLYDAGMRLAGEGLRSMRACSEVGMTVRLGAHGQTVRHGCLEVRVLWPTELSGG